MEVLDGQHDGPLPQPTFDQATHREEDLALELLGLDMAEAVGGLHSQDVSEEGRDRSRLLGAGLRVADRTVGPRVRRDVHAGQ